MSSNNGFTKPSLVLQITDDYMENRGPLAYDRLPSANRISPNSGKHTVIIIDDEDDDDFDDMEQLRDSSEDSGLSVAASIELDDDYGEYKNCIFNNNNNGVHTTKLGLDRHSSTTTTSIIPSEKPYVLLNHVILLLSL